MNLYVSLPQKRIDYLTSSEYEKSFWWWYKPLVHVWALLVLTLLFDIVLNNTLAAGVCLLIQVLAFPLGKYQQHWASKISEDLQLILEAQERYHENQKRK